MKVRCSALCALGMAPAACTAGANPSCLVLCYAAATTARAPPGCTAPPFGCRLAVLQRSVPARLVYHIFVWQARQPRLNTKHAPTADGQDLQLARSWVVHPQHVAAGCGGCMLVAIAAADEVYTTLVRRCMYQLYSWSVLDLAVWARVHAVAWALAAAEPAGVTALSCSRPARSSLAGQVNHSRKGRTRRQGIWDHFYADALGCGGVFPCRHGCWRGATPLRASRQ
jgi:hypothetical protein